MTNRSSKLITLVLGALLLVAPPALAKNNKKNPPPSPPPPPYPSAPDCARPVSISTVYRTPQDPTGADPFTAGDANPTGAGELQASYTLTNSAVSCAGYQYTLNVFDGDGSASAGPRVSLASQTFVGNGQSAPQYLVPVAGVPGAPNSDQYVCVQTVITDSSGALQYQAPSAGGCLVVGGGGASGQGFW